MASQIIYIYDSHEWLVDKTLILTGKKIELYLSFIHLIPFVFDSNNICIFINKDISFEIECN